MPRKKLSLKPQPLPLQKLRRLLLRSSPKNHPNSRIAFIGIGSELRQDDAVGVLIAKQLERWLKQAKIDHITAFNGGSAPENITGAIIQFRPNLIIIVDAADFGGVPGELRDIDIMAGDGSPSFSTHTLPLKVIAAYLVESLQCEVFVLGIQPVSTEICAPMSEVVKKASKEVVSFFKECLR